MMTYKIFIDAAVSAISGEIVKECISGIKNLIQCNIKRTSLLLTEKELENNIIDEVRKTAKWAYYDLFENKTNSGIQTRYVPLDLFLTPHRERTHVLEQIPKKSLKEIITEDKGNTVILGQPGSGKTTSVKYLVNSIFHDPDFLNGTYKIPIVIRLRELNKINGVYGDMQSGGIFEKLSLIFGLKFKIDYIVRKPDKNSSETPIDTTKEDDAKLRILLNSKILPYILDQQKILLILDGFDEIMDEHIKSLVISEIQDLANRLETVNFILTSRTSDYGLALENTHVYEISELNEEQVNEFSFKWFGNTCTSQAFIQELKRKLPYGDFYTRPLLLTQLAILFGRSNEIPDKPNEIYNRIIELILRDWNERQGLKRTSRYASFNVERKRKFLSAMAYKLSTKFYDRVYTQRQLMYVYQELQIKFPELPAEEVREVIGEIETHNGLIIQSAYDLYEFSHLTFQEYLTADYISHSSSLKKYSYEDLIKLPNELAVAVALSNDPYLYLSDLLEIILKGGLKQDFLVRLINRLKLEKPEFEREGLVIIAFLNIYTKLCKKYSVLYKGRYRENNYYAREAELSSAIELLEDIVKMASNDIKVALEEFYSQTYKITISNIPLIILEKKSKADDILGYQLPKNLYVNACMITSD